MVQFSHSLAAEELLCASASGDSHHSSIWRTLRWWNTSTESINGSLRSVSSETFLMLIIIMREIPSFVMVNHNFQIISKEIYFHYKTNNKNHKSPDMLNSSTSFFFNNTEKREITPSDFPASFSVVRIHFFWHPQTSGILCLIFDCRMR